MARECTFREHVRLVAYGAIAVGIVAVAVQFATGRSGSIEVPPEVLDVVDKELQLKLGTAKDRIEFLEGELETASAQHDIDAGRLDEYVRLVARMQGELRNRRVIVQRDPSPPSHPATLDPCTACETDLANAREALRDTGTACVVTDMTFDSIKCRAEIAQVEGENRLRGRLFGSARISWMTNGQLEFAVQREEIVDKLDFQYVPPGPRRKWRLGYWGGLMTAGEAYGPKVAVSAQRKRWGGLLEVGALFDVPDLRYVPNFESFTSDSSVEPYVAFMVGRTNNVERP